MSKKQRGFTLIEIMIVVSIVGILSIAGYPKMRAMLRHRALVTTARGYARAVHHARVTAMVQRKYVSVQVIGSGFAACSKDKTTVYYRYPESPAASIDKNLTVTISDWVYFNPMALLVDGNKTQSSYVNVDIKDTITKEVLRLTINAVGAIEITRIS